MFGRVKRYPEQINEEWYTVGKIALILLVAATVFMWWKGDAVISREEGCIYRSMIGIYCPGCGGTRAFYYLVHGNLWKSFLCNPFVLYTIGVYLFYMINTFLYMHTENIGFRKVPILGLIYGSVGLMVGQCIVRNILYLGFGLTVL